MRDFDNLSDSMRLFSTSRRSFIQKIFGIGVLTASAYFLSALNNVTEAATKKRKQKKLSTEVKPGEHDQYYGFWSGGPSGEVRILGIPSMRELKRIPVFNYDCTYGHGITNYTKTLLKGCSVGDTHHMHLSYNEGTYDGRYGFVNDKSLGRLARIRLDYMEVDSMISIPFSQGVHGIFPSRHKLDAVYCNSEFRSPVPNGDNETSLKPSAYHALHTCVDVKGAKIEVRWQVIVSGNLDLCATDYAGKYSLATCYNSEEGVTLDEMIAADRDWLAVFNLERIENAIKAGEGIPVEYGTGEEGYYHERVITTYMLDGRGKNPYVLYIPIPKNPHGVNIDPSGKYAICSGKLSPTVSIIPFEKIDAAFAGVIKNPRDCVIAEPELGIGPLHTAFDAEGNAYTSIFIDSVVCKWNIEKAVRGENSIIQKLDVHYQIGHINGTMSETKEVETKYIVSLNKFSKERFLPVGPYFPENDQLIGIEDGKMVLLHDSPTAPEPHDAVIVRKDIIETKQVWDQKDKKFYADRELASRLHVNLSTNRIIRRSRRVYVFMTSVAPNFGFSEITVKHGDRVQITQTNLDTVADTCHGFNLCAYNINYGVSPLETVSVSFDAYKKGVYWYYCPWFCHALHLEMCGRFIVL